MEDDGKDGGGEYAGELVTADATLTVDFVRKGVVERAEGY